ncbi:hypothetical protein ACPOL_2705 [Acidisarcina polymorpha]|uniref:Uncharacterized protein n=1 Tax=Acidisarcina polymorpha TaxID=2211140 RepID=A0A2Z5FYU1_9BACT|nr:hypothetical protein ACPOL_2705 [Acidisarcina polymorpha]
MQKPEAYWQRYVTLLGGSLYVWRRLPEADLYTAEFLREAK